MRVVDLSRAVAGAFCARLLALNGASVLAVGELPERGGGVWTSRYLRSGIRVFGEAEDGLGAEVGRADVLITGWDAGRPRHALPLRELNPAAVEVVVSTFGTDGPHAALPGSPLVDWASGGYLAITGLPTRAPLAGPGDLPAQLCGLVAASAAELGLRLRAQGVEGPRLEVSTMEVMAGAHQTSFSMYAATGASQPRRRHPQPIHPLDLIECADGWVSLGVVTDAQFDAFASIVGDPELLLDERFATGASRHVHAEAFDARVQPWFSARSAEAVVELLQAHQVPAVKLADPFTLLSDPQLEHRGYWQSWPAGGNGDGETGSMPGNPIHVRPSRAAADSTRPRAPRSAPPLHGALVVDFTDFWAGPLATRALGDLGATVVRLERSGSRSLAHPAAALVDWKMHRGKRSVALDLKHPEGRRVARELAARADVFVENFRPGVAARLGLGYEEVASGNPGLVYLSLSGFGQDGPHAGWASFGPVLEAASSLQARTRYPGGTPLQMGHALPDPVGGYTGLFAVLGRLRERQASGRGAYVDVSQLEAYAALCGEEVLRASVEGGWQWEASGGSVLRCRGEDAWVALDPPGGDGLEGLCAALGCTTSSEALEAAVAERDKFDVARIARGCGVPAFAVLDSADLAADPHLAARGFLVQLEQGGISARMPTFPVRGHPGLTRISERVPQAGEHTEQVLEQILGYSRPQIEELLASKAVATAVR